MFGKSQKTQAGMARGSKVGYGSSPFKFLIGPNKVEFFAHRHVLASQSDILRNLMEGSMSEAREQCASIEDVEPETFDRFLQFMYTGDYQTPDPDGIDDLDMELDDSRSKAQPRSSEPMSIETLRNPPLPPTSTTPDSGSDFKGYDEPPNSWSPDQWSTSYYPNTPPKGRKGVQTLSSAMEGAHLGVGVVRSHKVDPRVSDLVKQRWTRFKAQIRPVAVAAWEPRANVRASEDYDPVFQCHADLYVLADRYMVDELRQRTLQKLRMNLASFILFAEREADVANLARTVYENTMDRDADAGSGGGGGADRTDEMRALVADYCACHIHQLLGSKDFQRAVADYGQLGLDLLTRSNSLA